MELIVNVIITVVLLVFYCVGTWPAVVVALGDVEWSERLLLLSAALLLLGVVAISLVLLWK